MQHRVEGTGEQRPDAPQDQGCNSLHHARKQHIERALDKTGGDLDQAAALLAIPVSELRRLMSTLDIPMHPVTEIRTPKAAKPPNA